MELVQWLINGLKIAIDIAVTICIAKYLIRYAAKVFAEELRKGQSDRREP